MGTAKNCPVCKLTNPPDAVRCDCGYDFPSGELKQSYVADADPHAIPAGEIAAKRVESRLWLVAAILLCGATIAARLSEDFRAFYWLPAAAFIVVCCRYARCKGHSAAYGLLGLFSVVGLIVLVCMRIKTRGVSQPRG